jgi:hypothetical protein
MFWFAGDFYSYGILVTFIATKLREAREGRVMRLITLRKKMESLHKLGALLTHLKIFSLASNFVPTAILFFSVKNIF